MRIAEMTWMQVENFLKSDNRCILPIGSTEQHAQLSLAVDTILAERVSVEAAGPLGVPVFPVMPYGLAPYFLGYPGTVSLKVETLLAVVRDVIASLYVTGFRRVLIVNGHGGNAPVGPLALELIADRPDMSIKFHNWWMAPKMMSKVQEVDPNGTHANWWENFPWTRLPNIAAPRGVKPGFDRELMRASSPRPFVGFLEMDALAENTKSLTKSWKCYGMLASKRPARCLKDRGRN